MKTPFQLSNYFLTNARASEDGTTVALLDSDTRHQIFTPTANKIVKLPTTDIKKGDKWTLDNTSSTFYIEVQSSDTTPMGRIFSEMIVVALQDTPTAPSHWKILKLTEYLYTTGTWDADNSTMGYSIAGVTMGGTLTTGRAKTLTPLMAYAQGDVLVMQVNSDGFGWTSMSDQFPNTNASAGAYCYVSAANAITAYFRQYRAGTTNWGSSMKWRLVKITG